LAKFRWCGSWNCGNLRLSGHYPQLLVVFSFDEQPKLENYDLKMWIKVKFRLELRDQKILISNIKKIKDKKFFND
jgi:hypothetical protein